MSTSDDTTIPMFRQCGQCKNEFPLTIDYFYKRKQNRHGFTTFCRDCINENTKRWQSQNADKTREIKRKSAEKNKQKNNEKSRQRYREDESYRKRLKKHSDKWESRNKARINAKLRQRRDNPRYRMQNRLAQQHRKENTLLTEERVREMWEELQGRCAYCGISIFLEMERDTTIEHIVPITRGGNGESHNLTLICALCNTSKNNRLYEEWKAVRGW